MLFGYFRYEHEAFIKRFELEKDTDERLQSTFRDQYKKFFTEEGENLDIKEFYPGDTNSDQCISKIEFDDPEGLSSAIQNPLKYQICDPKKDLPYLVAVFTAYKTDKTNILIQLIEQRRLLLPNNRWILLAHSGLNIKKIKGALLSPDINGITLAEADTFGLQLDNKLTAVFDGSNLLFRSYFQVNRIFDLSEYLVEATEETMKDFFHLESIYSDAATPNLIKQFSESQRKKVARAMALGFIKNLSGKQLQERALKAKKPINIELKGGKIVIPEKANERAVILQFLCNGIMASYLDDGRDYMVASMRPV